MHGGTFQAFEVPQLTISPGEAKFSLGKEGDRIGLGRLHRLGCRHVENEGYRG